MYKLSLFFLSLLCLSFVSAKEISVLVEGKGTTAQEAKQDGWRQAVEKVVGIHLKAESKSEKFQLVMDRISVQSKGFVSRYKVYDIRGKRKERSGGVASKKININATIFPESSIKRDRDIKDEYESEYRIQDRQS